LRRILRGSLRRGLRLILSRLLRRVWLILGLEGLLYPQECDYHEYSRKDTKYDAQYAPY